MTFKKIELLRLELDNLNKFKQELSAIAKEAGRLRILPLVFVEILDLRNELQRAWNTCRFQLQQALDEEKKAGTVL
ncbi:MAG: hypothetical protein AAB784_02415 [Patescibacteria group bacterium]